MKGATRPENFKVTIYADGACLKNPGPGGYGAVLIYKGKEKEISEGFPATTNNRMELLGVISALEELKYPCKVVVFTDSRYIASAVNQGWLENWQRNGWKSSGGKQVKNMDLWKRLLVLLNRHEVIFRWVKGHSGDRYNERCDQLAKNAARDIAASLNK